jgi:signal peptidase I
MNKHLENKIIVKELGYNLLSEGKTLKVKAEGYSMYPAIRPGSVIHIEPLNQGSIPLPGELIAWKREAGLVVHRLVRIIKRENQTFFFTRGDACAREDQPVTIDQIAGRVVRIERISGKIKASEKDLIIKPNYLYNRLLVWSLNKINKLGEIINKMGSNIDSP